MKNKIALCLLFLSLLLTVGCSNQLKNFDGKQIEKPKYKITLSEDKKAILIAGKFEMGIYYDVKKIFNLNKSTVKALIYKSYGGLLNESDQLYKLAFKNKLNTYAIDFCNSACTVAFMGGNVRYAQRGTEFGFHQYGTSSTGGIQGGMAQRIIARQYKDRARFKKQGVDEGFIKKMYDTEYSGLWKPLQNKLVEANVINTLIKRNEMPFFNFKDKTLYPKKWI